MGQAGTSDNGKQATRSVDAQAIANAEWTANSPTFARNDAPDMANSTLTKRLYQRGSGRSVKVALRIRRHANTAWSAVMQRSPIAERRAEETGVAKRHCASRGGRVSGGRRNASHSGE